MKRQLFCSFATPNNLNVVIGFIIANFIPVNNLVFIYENADNPRKYVVTYNVMNESSKKVNTDNALAIHRKTETNTFYSINALNTLIKLVNNNILDTQYKVDWDLYSDMLLLTSKGELTRTGLEFKEKIKV